ncbi:Mitochondrial ATP synthase subunit G protein, partial [Melia azedarach]
MGSKLLQLQAKAAQASQFMMKNGSTYVKQLLEDNKHHVQEPPNIENCQLLAKQLFYTRLASIPNRREAFWKELDGLKKLLKNREVELNLDNAGIAALFGVECFAWFCGGEII